MFFVFSSVLRPFASSRFPIYVPGVTSAATSTDPVFLYKILAEGTAATAPGHVLANASAG